MAPKSIPGSKVVNKLLADKANLLSNENFKSIIREASLSKITSNQLCSVLKKIHEEFIYHLEKSQQSNDQNNVGPEVASSSNNNQSDAVNDQSNLITRLQYRVDALENEKVLYDNLIENNKITVNELQEKSNELEQLKQDNAVELNKRDDFYNYIIRIIKKMYHILNLNLPVDEQLNDSTINQEKQKLKKIDLLLLNFTVELNAIKRN